MSGDRWVAMTYYGGPYDGRTEECPDNLPDGLVVAWAAPDPNAAEPYDAPMVSYRYEKRGTEWVYCGRTPPEDTEDSG